MPEKGTLYLVATPIGNLEDITLRALSTLRAADVVACEDTRRARILLDRYGIRARLSSYFGAHERGKARELLGYLEDGKDVALVADAGMPGISDPGAVVVREAVSAGIRVVPVPGPSAAPAALAASGLPSDRFVFEGFPPRKAGERRKRTLGEIREAMGERRVVVVREMTKIHEEFIRGRVSEVMEMLGGREVKGEVMLLVEGAGEEIDWSRVDIPAFVNHLCEKMELERKEAVKLVARLSGLAKSVVYKETVARDS